MTFFLQLSFVYVTDISLSLFKSWAATANLFPRGESGWEVFPYMGYIGLCSPKESGFLAGLVRYRVLILAF